MALEESRISAMRAVALAKLLLTERDDLEILEEPPGARYDILVRIKKPKPSVRADFAVEVKGTRRALTPPKLRDMVLDLPWIGHDVSLPWCLVVFQVDTRQGMYCWLNEPFVFENAETALLQNWDAHPTRRDNSHVIPPSPPFSLLDAHALDTIVTRVVEWAEATEHALSTRARAS